MARQRLRVTKKQAIMKEVERTNPELPKIYLKREFYKITNKDYSEGKLNSTAWLRVRGIVQCCQCNAWDKVDNRFRICPVCLTEKKERSEANFLRYKRKQGLELELGY